LPFLQVEKLGVGGTPALGRRREKKMTRRETMLM